MIVFKQVLLTPSAFGWTNRYPCLKLTVLVKLMLLCGDAKNDPLQL